MERSEQKTMPRVGDFMRPDPPVVPYEARLKDALMVMIDRNSTSVLVMDGEDVVGVIGADDIARLAAKEIDLTAAWVKDFVAACMLTGNQPCVQIREDDNVHNALRIMDNWTASQIVVVNEKNKVVGTISALDALKGWSKEVYGP